MHTCKYKCIHLVTFTDTHIHPHTYTIHTKIHPYCLVFTLRMYSKYLHYYYINAELFYIQLIYYVDLYEYTKSNPVKTIY